MRNPPKESALFFRSASSVHRDVLYTILHFSFIPHSAATPFLTHTCVINSSLKHSIKIPHGLAQKKKRYSRTGTFSSGYFSSVRRFHSAVYIYVCVCVCVRAPYLFNIEPLPFKTPSFPSVDVRDFKNDREQRADYFPTIGDEREELARTQREANETAKFLERSGKKRHG